MDLSLQEIFIVIGVLAFSISVHESMHSFVAYLLGDRSSHEHGRISLNPLKHVDPLTTIALPLLLIIANAQPFAAAKPVMVRPWALKGQEFGMALVAVAGPVSNLLLALAGSFLLGNMAGASDLAQEVLLYFVSINVGLGLFNLIPFPPLDGSRALYAIAPDSLRELMNRIESFGFGAIIFFMFIVYPFISDFLRSANLYFLRLFLAV